MPSTKLTEKVIARLRAPDPSGRQMIHWDAELRGLGILCSGVTSSKTFIAQRALPGGRTRRVTIGSVAELGLREARERAARVILDMRSGIDPKAGRRGAGAMTLRATLDHYLKARSSLADRSRAGYRDIIERHLASWLERPIRDVTGDDVEAAHRRIKSAVESAGRHSGNATANGAMVALRTLWNFAAERDPTMAMNPVRRLKRAWFPVHRRERAVAAADLPRFYEAVRALPNPVARDYLLLLLFTGLRRREAAGLQWTEVDLVHGVIRLPAARAKSRQKLDLPMSDFVRDLLVARRALGNAVFVFPSSGRAGHIEEPKFPLRQVAEVTGIRVSAHDLRRTYVTTAESCDISALALSALVNHSLGSSVTSGYVRIETERLREAAQRVCDKMRSLCAIAEPGGGNVRKMKKK